MHQNASRARELIFKKLDKDQLTKFVPISNMTTTLNHLHPGSCRFDEIEDSKSGPHRRVNNIDFKVHFTLIKPPP
jgi:hypothetical protein